MSCCDTNHPMISKGGFTSCVPGAIPGGLTRTRFFDGMILTQADLENEQRFWRVKRRLTNRALGTGVVWGLRLRWDAKRRVFALGPGYALDCCGNDLIVECAIEAAESDLIATADPSLRGAGKPAIVNRADASRFTHASVVLQYVECPEDARPVHLDPCSPPSSRCEPSRIRETTRLLLVPPPASPASCIDDFFVDLQALKDSITDPVVRDQLFPPPPPPSPSSFPSSDASLPVTLRIATPGSGTRTEATLTPLANGRVPTPPSTFAPIQGTRSPTGGLNAGLVQFELRPAGDWGFDQGQVREGTAVVDVVAAPLDLQQFWALEIALPDRGEQVQKRFAYVVDNLGLQQQVAPRARGVATIEISGLAIVRQGADGQVVTEVRDLVIDSKSNVGEEVGTAGCFDRLRWIMMEDPANGDRDAKLLLLAAVYAYFAEVSATSSPQAQQVAALIYRVAWRLLGVNVTAPNADAQKRELARLLAQLFDCWCNAMLYPGPRCLDEHHGVHLGSVTIGPGGKIVAFDMWEHRRHVLLGPLVNHWLGTFGLAPLDVVASRIAQTICCIAGLPVPVIPDRGGVIEAGGRNATVPMGRSVLSVGANGHHDVAGRTRDVGSIELVGRMVAAFVADNGAPLTTFRTRSNDGTVIELVAPGTPSVGVASSSRLDDSVDVLLRRGDSPLPPLARSAARAGAAELAREVELSSLPELRGASAELAKLLGASGLTLAGVLDAGPEGVLAAVVDADPVAVDEVTSRAEAALASLAEAVAIAARKVAPARPSVLLRDAELRKSVATEAKKRLGVTRAKVDAALDRAAVRSA